MSIFRNECKTEPSKCTRSVDESQACTGSLGIAVGQSQNQQNQRTLTFEGLPPIILGLVFEYVDSRNLTNICCLSKYLYRPAVARIYHSIIITSEDDARWAHQYLGQQKLNYHTVISLRNVNKLVYSLDSNQSLGSLVYSMTFHTKCSQELMHQLLSRTINLRILHEETGINLACEAGMELNSLTCILGLDPQLTTNLVELHLIDSGDQEDYYFYRRIASDLVLNDAYANIRKLQFSAGYLPLNQASPWKPVETSLHQAAWIDFFEEFRNARKRINLTSLGLHGVLSGLAGEFIGIIQEAVDLSELRTLTLQHYDGAQFHNKDTTFFERISHQTPLLENLAIYPTSPEPTDQLDSICRTLEHIIPGQLKELFVSYVSANQKSDRQRLSEVIFSSQKSLVKLKIVDGSLLYPGNEEAISILHALANGMCKDWISEIRRQQMFPLFFDLLYCRPYISKEHVSLIRHSRSLLQQCLLSDPIYTGAAEYLPSLVQYYVGAYCFDMKQFGIFVNHETVLFDSTLVPSSVGSGTKG